MGNDRLPLLLQFSCALSAHVQIVADQKALITDQAFANGAVIHLLQGISDGCLPGHAAFLLVERIVDNFLAWCRWGDACFGKPYWLVAIFRVTACAGYLEQKVIFG